MSDVVGLMSFANWNLLVYNILRLKESLNLSMWGAFVILWRVLLLLKYLDKINSIYLKSMVL